MGRFRRSDGIREATVRKQKLFSSLGVAPCSSEFPNTLTLSFGIPHDHLHGFSFLLVFVFSGAGVRSYWCSSSRALALHFRGYRGPRSGGGDMGAGGGVGSKEDSGGLGR